MAGLFEIKKEIAGMSELALSMWRQTHKTFLEHNEDLIQGILDDENTLNDLEKKLTSRLLEAGRKSVDPAEKSQIFIYADVVADIELIGDYCKDILERIQIKIEEKLLFSEETVKEYEDLYRKTEAAFDEVVCALQRDNPDILKVVLKSEEHIDALVDRYRTSHNERMLAGVCTPLGCNMYLNMLDFTAAVYYHTKKIARNLLKLKG
jgi:phosphate:Na+ symporter